VSVSPMHAANTARRWPQVHGGEKAETYGVHSRHARAARARLQSPSMHDNGACESARCDCEGASAVVRQLVTDASENRGPCTCVHCTHSIVSDVRGGFKRPVAEVIRRSYGSVEVQFKVRMPSCAYEWSEAQPCDCMVNCMASVKKRAWSMRKQ
jgi:hypothetical protein